MMAMGGECLFSGLVPVHVRTTNAGPTLLGSSSQYGAVNTSSPLDSARRVDTITIELMLMPTVNGRKNLEFRLCDNADPFFLWQSTLSEEEFFLLRREQNLLVDYSRFPFKFIELLQQCIAHAREEHPSFAAWLQVSSEDMSGRVSGAQLTISEFTSFRQINHLSLKLAAANEQTMRKHLTDMVRQYKDEIGGLRSQLSETQRGLVGTLGGGGIFGADLTRQPATVPVFRSDDRGTSSRTGASYVPMAELQAMQEKIKALELQNQQLTSQKALLEADVYDLRAKLQSAQEETRRVAGLETAIAEKNQEILRLSEGLENARRDKRNLEENYGQLRTQLTQTEARLGQQGGDLNKANEIIKKLQEEIKILKQRVRSTELSLRHHEKLTKDTQQSYDATRTELQQVRNQLAERTQLVGTLEGEKQRLQSELEDAKKLVEANEKVIEWLHHQINEDALDRTSTRPSTNTAASYNLSNFRPLSEVPFGKDRMHSPPKIPSSASTSPPNLV